ncbi:hypothetical protein [Lysinibacillus piscis]|uniref:Uncharacterized protein n=1 Tax=Lysinibacillus piscis TaxID=2518931 RepID=A0ABQ5NKH2_9BACI|nr:hypothetical protein [Lysinibacillus sp. KH24]GLC88802.1 hypothetical protein LYSBPC_19290 [Lysinibacillus sp. KH24]
MQKMIPWLACISGNLLTLGAIFIYALQSHIQIALSSYILVTLSFNVILFIFFSVWKLEEHSFVQQVDEF